ncbi:VWA domain-containing protein [Salinispira pacifica]
MHTVDLSGPAAERSKPDRLYQRKHARLAGRTPAGRRSRITPDSGGRPFAAAATLRASALRRSETTGEAHAISRRDLRYYLETGDSGDLLLFLVDASDSMAAGPQLEAAKQTVVRLLSRRTRSRSRASILAFRDREARVLLPPTQSAARAGRLLFRLAGGGPTPLAAALLKAIEVMRTERRRTAYRRAIVVLLSDGEGNVRLPGITNEREERTYLRRALDEQDVQLLCVDTADLNRRHGPPDITPMMRLARDLGGEYLSTGRPEVDLLSVRWPHFDSPRE